MTTADLEDAKDDLKALLDKASAGEDVYIVDGARRFRLTPAHATVDAGAIRPGRGSWKGAIRLAPDWDAPLDSESLGLGPDGDFK